MTFSWYCSNIEELLTEMYFITKSEPVRSTTNKPRPLALHMEICTCEDNDPYCRCLGFYLPNWEALL